MKECYRHFVILSTVGLPYSQTGRNAQLVLGLDVSDYNLCFNLNTKVYRELLLNPEHRRLCHSHRDWFLSTEVTEFTLVRGVDVDCSFHMA